MQYNTSYVCNLPITLSVTAANGQGGGERTELPCLGDAFATEWQAFHHNVTTHSHPKTSPAGFRQDLELFQQMTELIN